MVLVSNVIAFIVVGELSCVSVLLLLLAFGVGQMVHDCLCLLTRLKGLEIRVESGFTIISKRLKYDARLSAVIGDNTIAPSIGR